MKSSDQEIPMISFMPADEPCATGDLRDNLFGTLAVRSHLILPEQLRSALELQRRSAAPGQACPRLGEVLVKAGYMTAEQVAAVLSGQSGVKRRFGEWAVVRSLCRPADVHAAVAQQTQLRQSAGRVPRLGELLVQAGALKPHQVHSILQAQGKQIVECPACKTKYNAVGLQAGSRLSCPRCKAHFIPVPATEVTSAPVLPAREDMRLDAEMTMQLPAVNAFARREERDKQIGDFKILGRLGENYSGVLYRALQQVTGSIAALRILSPQVIHSQEDFRRWIAAGEAATRLAHPNLQRIFAMQTEGEQAYLACEFIQGTSLRQALEKDGAFPETKAVYTLQQIARGLSHGHSLGLIHGDLRPSNILLGFDGSVRIEGLGLPKKIHRDLQLMASRTLGRSLPLYAAPEVLIAENRVEPRSDVYSLCAIGYHMLTGRAPHEGSDFLQAGLRLAQKPLIPPKILNPHLSAELNRILVKGLAPDPEQRYDSIASLERDLAQSLAAKDRSGSAQRPILRAGYSSNALPAIRNRLRGRRPYRTYLEPTSSQTRPHHSSSADEGQLSATERLAPITERFQPITRGLQPVTARFAHPPLAARAPRHDRPVTAGHRHLRDESSKNAWVILLGTAGVAAVVLLAVSLPGRRSTPQSSAVQRQPLTAQAQPTPTVASKQAPSSVIAPPPSAAVVLPASSSRLEPRTAKVEPPPAAQPRTPAPQAIPLPEDDHSAQYNVARAMLEDARAFRLQGKHDQARERYAALRELDPRFAAIVQADLETPPSRKAPAAPSVPPATLPAKPVATPPAPASSRRSDPNAPAVASPEDPKTAEGLAPRTVPPAGPSAPPTADQSRAQVPVIPPAVPGGKAEPPAPASPPPAAGREASAPRVTENRLFKKLEEADLSVSKGTWSITTEGALAGEPEGGSAVCSLRKRFFGFKNLSVEIKGAGALNAGFSFGPSIRFLIAPTASWQTLEVATDAQGFLQARCQGKPVALGTSKDQPKFHQEMLDQDFYLRGENGRILFRNLTLDGQTLRFEENNQPQIRKPDEQKSDSAPAGAGKGPELPAQDRQQDPKAEAELKRLGWEIVSGVWRLEGPLFAAHGKTPGYEILVLARPLGSFARISVEVRGQGEVAGLSLGAGRRYSVRPLESWQQLSLEQTDAKTVTFLVDGEPRASLDALKEDEILSSRLFLRAKAERIEFRNLKVE